MKNSILYHGSTVVVKQPLAHISRQDLDFGPGFYVSNDRNQVERWAHVVDKYLRFKESIELK